MKECDSRRKFYQDSKSHQMKRWNISYVSEANLTSAFPVIEDIGDG